MKKVLVGYFTTECNENIPELCEITDYDIAFGDECIKKCHLGTVAEEEGVELIPSIYTSAGSAGIVSKEAFEYILKKFTRSVRENLGKIDGIWLHLHGASYVEEYGSGDFEILRQIREIVGPYMPIAIACDPHGNLTKEYTESTTLIRSYRESPHTDCDICKQDTLRMLCRLLKSGTQTHSVYRKLPLILGGEQSVSADEPVCTINKYMDELEKDPRILSVSWHVGYLRHDCPEAGCAVVVVPASDGDRAYCETVADELADFVWNKRHEFHYTGLTAQPDEALKMALEFDGSPVFITDSGDNVTSGATGWNTFILRQVLAVKDLKKKVCFANINDPKTYDVLKDLPVGTKTTIKLGMGYDELSTPVELNVTVGVSGTLYGFAVNDADAIFGGCVTVHCDDYPIDIVVANHRQGMCEIHQFKGANIDWDLYDIIVVKQGYIFPDCKEKGKLCVMSLTMGATPQDTAKIPYKLIMRPMYPIDNI